jgi:hypothetical protein
LLGRSIRAAGRRTNERFWEIIFVAKDTIFSAGKKLEFSEILMGIRQDEMTVTRKPGWYPGWRELK